MAQLTDFQLARRRRARKKLIRNLLMMAGFGLVVFLCLILIQEAGKVDIKTAYNDVKAEMGTGGGYPVELPGGKLLQLEGAGGDTLMLLTDTNLYSYNGTGKQMLNQQHGMANQRMITSSDRTLLYDQGGLKVSLYSKSGLVNSMESDFNIYTGDIASNGNFVLATQSDTHLAQVTVYNKEMQWFYRWRSSDRPIISVSLSDVRDEMVVGCVDVSGGSYLSSISRFLLSTDKELGQVELPGELLLQVDYAGGNLVRAISDQKVTHFSADLKKQAEYSYGNRELNRFAVDESGMALVFGSSVGAQQYEVVALDLHLKESARITVDYEPVDVKLDSRYIYLEGQDAVEIYSRLTGTLMARLTASSIYGMEPFGERLYYATTTNLDMVVTKGLIEEQKDQQNALNQAESSSQDTSSQNTSGQDTSSEISSGDEASSGSSSSQESSSQSVSDGDSSSETQSSGEAVSQEEASASEQETS